MFLGRSVVGAGVAFPFLGGNVLAAARSPRGKPKRIIHLVSDGMSMGTLSCANHLSQVIRKCPLTWMELYRRPEVVPAWMDTRSLNSLVTDSAAASSSWGSGSRVKNGALNRLPDGRALRTLAELFGQQGWVRGLVTTTEITHATPAGFAASVSSRSDADTIARQYLERRIEVLLGGGRQYFDPKRRGDHRDLEQEYTAWGYHVFQDRETLLSAPARGRWLGLFADGHLPYTVDRRSSPSLQQRVPTLAEMTQRALEHLEPYGAFLLQVEGGRVDHGAHASDAPAMLYDQLAFDEAIDVCLKFQADQGNTLIVITTDHGNSDPALLGMGSDYGDSPALLKNLERATCSFGEIQSRWVKAAGPGARQKRKSADGGSERDVLVVEPEVVRSVLEETTGYRPARDYAERFAGYLAGDWRPVFGQLDAPSAQLGQLLANYYGIGWTGTNHTSDHVPLVALGPGAGRFGGFIDNTDVFRLYTELAGIRFRNPALPLMAESRPTAAEVEPACFA